MRIAMVVAVALCLAACEDSGTTAGPGPAGAAGVVGTAGTGAQAGTGGPAAGSTGAAGAAGAAAGGAGADPECHNIYACSLDAGQLSFLVGSASKEYSSPTCPGRICVPCGARLAGGGSTGIHGCFTESSDESHFVYCDNSYPGIPGTDCN